MCVWCEHRYVCAIVCVWRSEYNHRAGCLLLLHGSQGLNSRNQARAEPSCQLCLILLFYILIKDDRRLSFHRTWAPQRKHQVPHHTVLYGTLPYGCKLTVLIFSFGLPTLWAGSPSHWRQNTWANHLPLITLGCATSGISPSQTR